MRVLNFLIYNFLFDKNKLLTIQDVIALYEVIENVLRTSLLEYASQVLNYLLVCLCKLQDCIYNDYSKIITPNVKTNFVLSEKVMMKTILTLMKVIISQCQYGR